MLFGAFAPSPALQLATFADVDAFHPDELAEDARSIPLDVAHFSAARAVVRLPSCRIIVMQSFARIMDTAYRVSGGMVILPMTDDLEGQLNGADLDARFFVALRGNHDCHFVEPRSNAFAIIIFSPSLRDRGWFDRADMIQAYVPDRGALMHVRRLVLDILRTASAEPGLFTMAEIAAHLQDGLLLAIDALFRADPCLAPDSRIVSGRISRLVQRLDDYVAADPTSPVYTEKLAREFGVSMRTLGSAVSKLRGMSLHQYIRLKRLWATRTRLLKGGDGITVAGCARAQGFHHMGEFAAIYRATFNETPSETLARGRLVNHQVA
jgi:AraC family ethanolamine operon transcriptional activator